MTTRRLPPLASVPVFFGRLGRTAALSLVLLLFTLAIGTLGYHVVAHVDWIDAFHQSSLLMSGMGPLDERDWSVAAKLFDSVYALFCGVILLVSVGVLLAPVIHRLVHKFHIEDAREK